MKDTILSAVIITKNAEKLIKEAIESVSFCDEVLIVDANSSDSTVSLAKSLGAHIIAGKENNFAAQRNLGLMHAKGKWILYIDTDERVSKELAKNILDAIKTEEYQAYKIKRENFYLGKNKWPKIEYLERLFLKHSLSGWYGELHESPKIDGQIGILDGYLLHFTHRDLESMLNKTIQWSQTEAKLRFDSGHPTIVIWRLIRVMITAFFDSYIVQGGWRAGEMGFVESMYQSYSMFITYARLWEMQKK